MKKISVIIFVLFLCISVNAQILFQKTYGGTYSDIGNSVIITPDGGYIIGGWTENFGTGSSDIYLIKTNAFGDTLWTRTIGGLGPESASSIQQTSKGDIVVVGSTSSFGNGNGDVLLVKTDSTGNILWARTYGGTYNDSGNSLQETSDKGFIITGYTQSFGVGSIDVYLIKTDSLGNIQWTKTFGGTTANQAGHSVKQTMDGGYIVCATTHSFGIGGGDVYLIKVDSVGNYSWSRTYGGGNWDEGQDIVESSDGGLVICGYSSSFSGNYHDVYLIKTDNNGNLLWSRTFGEASGGEFGFTIQQTFDFGYIIAGSGYFNTNTNAYLLKTDYAGNLLWSRTYGSTTAIDRGYCVKQTPDSGYVITGYTEGFGSGVNDIYLIKVNSLGNVGCNQSGLPTMVDTPNTQVTLPATIVSQGGVSTVWNPISNTGSIVTLLCLISGATEEYYINDEVFLFPNPATSEIKIENGKSKIENVEIFNTLGEKVYDNAEDFQTNTETINVSKLSSGIYFVRVRTGEGMSNGKFVKE